MLYLSGYFETMCYIRKTCLASILLLGFGLSHQISNAQNYTLAVDTIESGWINDSVMFDIHLYDDSIRIYREYLPEMNENNSGLFQYYGYFSRSNINSGGVIEAGRFNIESEREGMWYARLSDGFTVLLELDNGIQYGVFRELFPNGSVSRAGNVDTIIVNHNILHIMEGEWITYYQNGIIESRGIYRRPTGVEERNYILDRTWEIGYNLPLREIPGIKVGKWYYYSKDGDIEMIEQH